MRNATTHSHDTTASPVAGTRLNKDTSGLLCSMAENGVAPSALPSFAWHMAVCEHANALGIPQKHARTMAGIQPQTLRKMSAAEIVAHAAHHGRPMPTQHAVRMVAALAIGSTAHDAPPLVGMRLTESKHIGAALIPLMRDMKRERFLVLMLDGKNKVIGCEVVSVGILTASLVHPREVFAPAIRLHAGGIIVAHNHPSGDPEPSAEDVEVTRRLVSAGDLLGIRVLDHVVVGASRYVSFLERGMISN